MKILYFYQYFSTPKGSWGTRVYDFAKEWVKEGHEVTVVTSIYAKSDLKAEKLIEVQNFEGIKVIVINIGVDNKQGFLQRIWTFIQYSLLASWYAIKLPADVVVASSGPITVGLPGLIAKWFRGRKLALEVRDLWPQGAIEVGVLKNNLIIKAAYAFERVLYNNADAIITLSPGMIQNIVKRFPKVAHKMTSVPNAANLDLFASKPDTNEPPLPPPFAGKSIAIYTGNIGQVNNTILLVKTAKLLQDRNNDNILFLLIGEGQQKEEIQTLANEWQLKNFVMLNLMPKHELIKYLRNSMVSLVPLKGTPILDTSSPNKLFESLAMGIPVIQNTNGWLKDLLADNRCGITVSADDPNDLATQLSYLAANPDEGKRMGENGRKIIEAEFDKNYLAKKMLKALTHIAT